ncbi:MAG: hypothetical protein KDK04_20680 [Candidatus Competibacteraceae bacterium]|nr:hypothetical protein [Candidatus Competibacteraceae bacterium]MCB1814110.1 hypothetical protein [Candidatus Competibacteraceae bacterium]
MKSITLHADDKLIEAAQERARIEHTTLDEQLRLWLEDYVQRKSQAQQAVQVMRELQGKVRIGRKLTRDEMNER